MTLDKNVQLKMLVSLVGRLTDAYPNPENSNPIGPWGSIMRGTVERLRRVYGPQPEPWVRAALNPQPIPPRFAVAIALAQTVIDHISSLGELAKALPEGSQESVASYSSGVIKRFVDDCGNGMLIIQLRKHGPFPPSDDEPKPINPEELIVIGAQLANAAYVHQDFETAGITLIEIGLNHAR